jgi:hypothetical protein
MVGYEFPRTLEPTYKVIQVYPNGTYGKLRISKDIIFDDMIDFKTETGYPTDSAFNVGIDEQERTVTDTPPAQTPPVLPAPIIQPPYLKLFLDKTLARSKHPTRASPSPSLPLQGFSNHNLLVPLSHYRTLYRHRPHWHRPRRDYLNPGSPPHQTLSLGPSASL